MTRQDKRNLRREASAVAADAVGLKYGPSECRPDDADDFLKVFESRHSTVSATVPVQYVLTRNRGILETLAR